MALSKIEVKDITYHSEVVGGIEELRSITVVADLTDTVEGVFTRHLLIDDVSNFPTSEAAHSAVLKQKIREIAVSELDNWVTRLQNERQKLIDFPVTKKSVVDLIGDPVVPVV